jgi:hypothetical protein
LLLTRSSTVGNADRTSHAVYNTNTGVLTEAVFVKEFSEIATFLQA